MQVTVCVAIPPSTDARIKIGADRRAIDPVDLKYELNPYDDFAVEQAIRLKEAAGQGEVSVLHVGDGAAAREELRKCLARGADRAVLLKADIAAADSGAVAQVLADHMKGTTATLVLFGKQAVDGDNGQVPYFVARALGWPIIAKVSQLSVDGAGFTAHREIEGGVEVIQGLLPAVFTAEKGLAEIRYPSLKGIMAAKKKPLDEVLVGTLASPALVTEFLEPPPPRPEGRIIGDGAAAAATLIDLLRNEAKII